MSDPSKLGRLWILTLLHAVRAFDRARLAWRARRHPGLEIHPLASSNFASAEFRLAPGARLRIGAGAVTERRRGGVRFVLEPGASVEVGEGAWLRSDLGTVHVVAFEGARIEMGPRVFLNGCHVSAKTQLVLGTACQVGPGSRIFDADQHDFDDARPEQREPVEIGEHTWIASDVTVLRGVSIGAHSIVGTRSVVIEDVPPHTFAAGAPARARGVVGDRTHCR